MHRLVVVFYALTCPCRGVTFDEDLNLQNPGVSILCSVSQDKLEAALRLKRLLTMASSASSATSASSASSAMKEHSANDVALREIRENEIDDPDLSQERPARAHAAGPGEG